MTLKNNTKSIITARIILSIVLFALFTILFYRQAINYEGRYFSDLPAHISFATNGDGYSILYFTIGLILKIIPNVISIAALESLLIIISWFMTEKLIVKYFQLETLTSMLISTGLIFLSSIYIPFIAPYFYNGGIVTQPWHNITYLGMRVFAVITLYYFPEIFQNYKEEISFKDWCKIAIPLAFATSIKPNFLISFAFTLLLFLIIDFFQGRLTAKKFKNIIIMGTTVFPSCLILLFQSFILFSPGDNGESSGIIITLLGSEFLRAGFKSVLQKLVRALTFPTLVLIFNRKKLNRSSMFMYVMYIITLLQVILLHETGERANHGNFYWGLYSSGYFLFCWYVPQFIINIKNGIAAKQRQHAWYYVCGSLLLTAHLLSGLAYFMLVFLGGNCLS